jgi:hypothetical protein
MYALGQKHYTDKIYHHRYDRFYEDYLHKYINKKFNFLEIGMDYGESMKLWKDYFKYANIFGLEIRRNYKEDRINVVKGDQNKLADLQNLIKITKNCDVILDDGSHVPEHQLFSFNFLFEKCLNYGGTYIIEDIETSYWKNGKLYGYDIKSGPNTKKNIVNIFRIILPIVNREFLTETEKNKIYKKKLVSKYVLDNISSINFGMNCIIIKKMTKEEKEKFGNRIYRFKHFL